MNFVNVMGLTYSEFAIVGCFTQYGFFAHNGYWNVIPQDVLWFAASVYSSHMCAVDLVDFSSSEVAILDCSIWLVWRRN